MPQEKMLNLPWAPHRTSSTTTPCRFSKGGSKHLRDVLDASRIGSLWTGDLSWGLTGYTCLAVRRVEQRNCLSQSGVNVGKEKSPSFGEQETIGGGDHDFQSSTSRRGLEGLPGRDDRQGSRGPPACDEGDVVPHIESSCRHHRGNVTKAVGGAGHLARFLVEDAG